MMPMPTIRQHIYINAWFDDSAKHTNPLETMECKMERFDGKTVVVTGGGGGIGGATARRFAAEGAQAVGIPTGIRIRGPTA